jgi:hypothetical protein
MISQNPHKKILIYLYNIRVCIKMVLVLPVPITTSPQSSHELIIKNRQNKTICNSAPLVKFTPNMRYDIFIDSAKKNEIEGVCMSDHQKSADILMNDKSYRTIYFPENYDIINFLLEYDIPLEIHESHIKPSIIDILGIIIQVSIIRLISNIFNNNKQSTEDI